MSQLLYAAKKKLRGLSLDGRCVWTVVVISKGCLKRTFCRIVTTMDQFEVRRNEETSVSMCTL